MGEADLSCDVLTTKGMALANDGKLEEALVCFEKVTKINPLDPKGWNNKGVVLRDLGRYDEAVACFNKAIELNPFYEVAMQNREYALLDINRNSDENSVHSMSHIL